jgi:hypothetical protein
MSAWQVSLSITPMSGATGSLTFADPMTSAASPPPSTERRAKKAKLFSATIAG